MLQRTFRRKVASWHVVSPELARHLSVVSHQIGRQVGVLINRAGTVRQVVVGDRSSLMIPEIGRLRGGPGRFRGLRLVHTHLGGEPLSGDDLNDLALLRLDLVAVIEVTAESLPGSVELAHILPPVAGQKSGGEPYRFVRSRSVYELDLDFDSTIRALEEEFARIARNRRAGRQRERAVVVALVPCQRHLEEMFELVRSAGVQVAATVRQSRFKPHPRTVVGKGKLQEIVLEGMRRQAEVAIFDIDLTPAQARAFEDATGLKAVDRTQLILDIFAQRAHSRDGKLQVELAQLKYSLPRLTEKDEGLSRLTGGVGGRGPGETVLEIGRRRIRERIQKLEKEISRLSRQRDLRRSRRRNYPIPVLAIIGYTNAGKSTLLNALTNSSVKTADQMFMTLDPTNRRLRFPHEGDVILTDTVGFLQDLPRDLLAAFRATLEELADADLLLHVVDAADDKMEEKIDAVEFLLAELGLKQIPRLLVFNKADLLKHSDGRAMARRYSGVVVSALKRRGLGELIRASEGTLQGSADFNLSGPAVCGN